MSKKGAPMSLSLATFLATIEADHGPASALSALLRALWLDARGDWDGAHKCVDVREDTDSMWVHAYLHRKQGDLSNARYWYARARRPLQECLLDEEWRAIAAALLAACAQEEGSCFGP
jgi:hypothetical protein